MTLGSFPLAVRGSIDPRVSGLPPRRSVMSMLTNCPRWVDEISVPYASMPAFVVTNATFSDPSRWSCMSMVACVVEEVVEESVVYIC